MHGFGGFGMFSLMGIIMPVFFLLVMSIIIIILIKGVGEWNHNNKQAVITVVAEVVGKRGDTSGNYHHNNHIHTSSTAYYATFQVESGDRMEFLVPAKEFAMLVEGDIGKLTFQGSRYHSFERVRK